MLVLLSISVELGFDRLHSPVFYTRKVIHHTSSASFLVDSRWDIQDSTYATSGISTTWFEIFET